MLPNQHRLMLYFTRMRMIIGGDNRDDYKTVKESKNL